MKAKTKKRKSTISFVDRIKKQNAAFKKMTKAEKRCAVAQDVLDQMQVKKILASSGRYTRFMKSGSSCSIKYEKTSGQSLQEAFFGDKKLTCSACAKGGMFLSYIHKANEFKIDDLSGSINGDENEGTNEFEKLKEIFSAKQLNMIEAAFEGWSHPNKTYSDESNDPVLNFRENAVAKSKAKKQTDSTITLTAIMNNIIANKGTFKP